MSPADSVAEMFWLYVQVKDLNILFHTSTSNFDRGTCTGTLLIKK